MASVSFSISFRNFTYLYIVLKESVPKGADFSFSVRRKKLRSKLIFNYRIRYLNNFCFNFNTNLLLYIIKKCVPVIKTGRINQDSKLIISCHWYQIDGCNLLIQPLHRLCFFSRLRRNQNMFLGQYKKL